MMDAVQTALDAVTLAADCHLITSIAIRLRPDHPWIGSPRTTSIPAHRVVLINPVSGSRSEPARL
jgi:hypothetical protein